MANSNDKTASAGTEQTAPEATPTQSIDIEALKTQLKEDILADMKKEAADEDAKKNAAPASDPYLEEYVQVQLFKDGKDYKDDVFVCVNGENCVIKRGYPVKVKRKFALVLEQSQAQDVKAAEYAEAQQREFDQQVKYFNL
ncbi:MAG: hypothetical protein RR365_03985 [Bacteroides sp.]